MDDEKTDSLSGNPEHEMSLKVINQDGRILVTLNQDGSVSVYDVNDASNTKYHVVDSALVDVYACAVMFTMKFCYSKEPYGFMKSAIEDAATSLESVTASLSPEITDLLASISIDALRKKLNIPGTEFMDNKQYLDMVSTIVANFS